MKILNYLKGRIGEDKAVWYLKKHGYKIIERNFKTNFAEIDIIAIKNKILTFIEVKSRFDDSYGLACEAVDEIKIEKIRKNAIIFTSQCNLKYEGISFDILEIYYKDDVINHIKNAF